jgi:hypothetical protein
MTETNKPMDPKRLDKMRIGDLIVPERMGVLPECVDDVRGEPGGEP